MGEPLDLVTMNLPTNTDEYLDLGDNTLKVTLVGAYLADELHCGQPLAGIFILVLFLLEYERHDLLWLWP